MGKKVICERCNGEVTQEYDLVTDTNALSVVAYHVECYGSVLKQGKSIFLGNQPLNGAVSNFMTVLAVFFTVILIFTGYFIPVFILMGALFYRGYSYFVYERPLKERH